MRFKLLLVAILTTFNGCGYTSDYSSPDFEVGRKPEFFSASYLWKHGNSNEIVAIDRTGHTVQRFTLEPFEHIKSLPLPLDYEEQGVVSSIDGRYYIATAGSEYAILKSNGDIQKNPVELLGTIRSIAYSPLHHLVVLSDEFQTMAILVLNGEGDVTGSWKAGSLFPDNKYVLAGAMMDDGRLVLSLGQTTIGVVNITESVAAQSWVYTSFEVSGAESMAWIATIPGMADHIMVMDTNRALSLNITAKTVDDTKDLTSTTVLGYYRDYSPHVLTQSSSQSVTGITDVSYIGSDGKFVTKSIRGTSKQVTQTLLDATSDVFTVVYDPGSNYSTYYQDPYYKTQEVYRFRLSDNMALDASVVTDRVNLAVLPGHLFLLYPSSLGKATRQTYGKEGTTQTLEGYNLDLYRDRYRNN